MSSHEHSARPPVQSALTATVTKMATPSTISQKVSIPLLVGVGAGIALVLLSFVFDDEDLRKIGISVVVAALGYGGIGYVAPVGRVSVQSQTIETRPSGPVASP